MNTDINTPRRSLKIDREDMLALTRRMTVKRTSITRIAGAYMDPDGFIDGTFNTRFLKLSGADRAKNLEIARTIPFAKTNGNLKRYVIPGHSRGRESIYQLLMGIRSSGLENDALLEIFYEMTGEKYRSDHEYGIFVFHDRYDVPVKTSDKERQWDSEEVYEYLICALCPLADEYEPDKPLWGFLFPAFTDRSCDWNHINIFHAHSKEEYQSLDRLLGVEEKD